MAGKTTKLGIFDATMIVMGGIVGSGIFINPYVVARHLFSPGTILTAWAVGGAIALAGAFIYAELGARLPEAGGQYAYLRDAYHPSLAFLYGWVLLLVIQTGGMAAVAVTFSAYFLELTKLSVSPSIAAILVLAGLALVNCLGLRAGSSVQSALMVMKIVAILVLVAGGAWFLSRGGVPPAATPASAVMARTLGPRGSQWIAVGIAVSTLGFLSQSILAEPALAERMWRHFDFIGASSAHTAERMSVVALDHLGQVATRARALLDRNRQLLDRFLDSRSDLDVVRPQAGTVCFPKLRGGRVDELCRILREKYDTSVVPGRFFEMPDHFRIGIGGETAMVEEGLARLSTALDEI